MNQTWEHGKEPNRGLNLARLTQIWAPIFFSCLVRHYNKLSFYAIPRKAYDPNSRKQKKISFWARFRPAGSIFEPPTFSFKNLVSSVTRYYDEISSCTISDKTNDPILRKFSDLPTDRQTDEFDFIERCPTNAERPT